MEIIHLSHSPDPNELENGERVIALGYFDGVHIGHQKVIGKAIEEARKSGRKAAVMTFHPHPSVVLKQLNKREDYLTPTEEKARLMRELGVDELYIVKFDKAFSQLTPQEFVDQYLIKLEVKHVVAGFDFTYGRMAKGNMSTIKEESRNMFCVTVISKVEQGSEKVSTTHIRELISEGRVSDTISLLGRPYSITGMVVRGDKRGQLIDGPTATIKIHAPYLYPKTAVYAVDLDTDSGTYKGVGYVGFRTTFKEHEKMPLIKVYLFDFEEDLYGETVTIHWYEKLRDEESSDDVDALKSQIEKDKEEAIAYFKLTP